VVGKDEIVLQTANGSGAHVVTRFQIQISRDQPAFVSFTLERGC
jgi:hypothetical protein